MPDPASKAVFLSYASQDVAAAKRICEALRAAGVEVWFDQDALVGGDAWDQKIRGQIGSCTLFVPIVSVNTQARKEGYFRLEWKLAEDRSHLMAKGFPFIVPVSVDGTTERGALVPDAFLAVQWTKLPGGDAPAAFVARVQKLLGGPSAPTATATSVAPTSASVAPAGRTGLPHWVGFALGAVVLTLIGFFVMRPGVKDAVPAFKPVAEAKPSPVAAPLPVPPAADKSAPAEKSVAVLAFANLSDDKANEYFSDGISEELLNVLAKVPGLKVSARTSAFHFKGKDTPIPEIAKQLGVAYVVEGSVRKAGSQVRITAQLIKAADGFHVWSDTFTRELKDVFALQDEIAGLIAKNLSLKLGASSAVTTAAVMPEAFELYVQARQAWNLRTSAGFDRAEALLGRALALEPNFARAHAALADVWMQRFYRTRNASEAGDQPNSAEQARILAKITQALTLDPDSAEAHASLGNMLRFDGKNSEAESALRRAVALNPNYASAHQWLGRVLFNHAQMAEALEHLKLATELDPLTPVIWGDYGFGLSYAGRPAEGIIAFDRALTLQPNDSYALCCKSLALVELGRFTEAVALARRLRGDDVWTAAKIFVFARAGLKAEAEALLAEPRSHTNNFFPWAGGLLALGRTEEAMALMTPKGIKLFVAAIYLLDPIYDSVRNDPRWVKLMADAGLTEAHARALAWRAAHPPEKPAK